MSVHLDTSEVDALAADMQAVSGRIGAAGSAIVRKTAFDIEARASALAPVDTGNLKGSISTAASGDGRHGSMSATVTAHASYAAYVELGTSRMGPQPFLGPAFDSAMPGFRAAVASLGAEAVFS